VHRCEVFQHALGDGASIDRIRRDANGQRWPAEPARVLSSTEATTFATTARACDQMRESGNSNGRGRLTGDAAQDSRAGVLDASTRQAGRPQPFPRRHASLVQWPTAAPTSTDLCPDEILARHSLGIR
jgi:hypothetical protein